MDVTPPRSTKPVAAYPRSALDEFIASAKSEERRISQAIADAEARTQRATFAADESEATSKLLRSRLHELRREFADRRLQVEAQAEGMIAAARDESGRILAEARDGARPRISTPSPIPAIPERQPASVAGSATEMAGEAGNAVAPPSPSPTTLVDGPAAAPPPGARPGEPSTDPPAVGNGTSSTAPTNMASPSAASTHSPTLRDETASGAAAAPGDRTAPAATMIDLTNDAPTRAKGTGLTSRLRRGRHRDAAADTAASSDEFLDFLRGALLDDSPLDQPSEPEKQVDWRWTS